MVRLVDVMAVLRSPHGCPWDRQQTHASLRRFLIEETYEAVEAIDRDDLDDLCGELGDVLLQCVFHAQLAAEAGRFQFADVADAVTGKLIRRHPHVFTPEGRPLGAAERRRRQLASADAVKERWAELKAQERGNEAERDGVLAGIPRALPALLAAHTIGSRVKAVGFDWPRAGDVLDKIDEEVRELRGAFAESPARAREELGDLLFSIANLARKLGIDPEAALAAANAKFTRRFQAVEAALRDAGRDVHSATPAELEEAWAAIKRRERRLTAKATTTTTPETGRRPRSRSASSRRRSRS